MTFAEDIVVMDRGRVVQIGKPKELFERPSTTFVGYFIGAPAMNMFEARMTGKNVVAVGDVEFATETDLSKTGTENIKLGIRSSSSNWQPRRQRTPSRLISSGSMISELPVGICACRPERHQGEGKA